jgi:hypothetical protein
MDECERCAEQRDEAFITAVASGEIPDTAIVGDARKIWAAAWRVGRYCSHPARAKAE